jgi:uncharacterized protein
MVTADRRPVLIAAVTGRALAASAARGGYSTVVLDYFGDRDTVAAARACRVVAAPRALRFNAAALLAGAAELASPARSAGLVYGSGFEGRPRLLSRLASGRRLFGNPAGLIARLRDPARFFPLLDRLGIPHPAVRLTPPAGGGWLAKLGGGSGGVHVRPVESGPPRPAAYYQRWEQGRPMSVLFLADGRRAMTLGISRQWITPAAGLPFRYGGAVGRAALPPGVRSRLADRLDALVRATGLVGLNGIDFLVEGERWLVLELNPRPPATMDLYDLDYPAGLFHWHLQAALGTLPPAPAPARAVRAHLIVHAPAAGVVGESPRFPRWCRDLPQPGTGFRREDPVCTVVAAGRTGQAAATLVRRRHAAMVRALRRAAAQGVGA